MSRHQSWKYNKRDCSWKLETIFTLIIHLVYSLFVDAQRVVQIGNELSPGGGGQNAVGVTFLLNQQVPVDGQIYAFSAYISSRTQVRLQIWRPVVNGSDPLEHTLVAEYSWLPTTQGQREDVSTVGE